MQEREKIQQIPVKMYRTPERLMVAAPMPGLQPADITVEITPDAHLLLQGEMRAMLKDIKELLLDEWSVGDYYRDLPLPVAVDGELANLNYGNGVLVVALPVVERTRPAVLALDTIAPSRGERMGNSGHPPSWP